MTNADRLKRIQAFLGVHTVGVYLGVYTNAWRAPQFQANVIDPWRNLGASKPDYALVKCGEWGREWYDGTFPAIRAAFTVAGFGCVPYYFCRPDTWQEDAAICAKLATEAGGVVLDCEEQFVNHNAALDGLVAAVRAQCGAGPIIIVSGYGDPQTAVPTWDFTCLAAADAYQPQWYIGYWNYVARGGVEPSVRWGDGQCAAKFQAANLGADYPIQPAINCENVTVADFQHLTQYVVNGWQASVAVWVQSDMTAALYQAARAGAGHGGFPMNTIPAKYQAAGWADDGVTLTNSGVGVIGGFRQHILDAMAADNWRVDDAPLGAEYATPTAGMIGGVESHGPGREQMFRHTLLGYTGAEGTFEVWCGSAQQTWREQYAALQAQLAAAQNPPPAPLPEYAVESMAMVDHLAAALAAKGK